MGKKKRKKEATEGPGPEPQAVPAPAGAWNARDFFLALAITLLVGAIGVAVVKAHLSVPAPAAAPVPAPDKAAPDKAAELEPSTAPLKSFQVVNAHEHLFSRKYLNKYLAACQRTGVAKTLFVASSEFTLKGKGADQAKGNEENTEELLAAANEHPDAIIPFCTIYPGDPQKLEKIKEFVARGAKGLKLYNGHGNFHSSPMDTEDMMPVYAYCAETGLPICWHVNYPNYKEEFIRILEKFPQLRAIVPHFGVTFFRPGSTDWNEFEQLFDRYPNLYTDTSFGTREILVSGLETVSRRPDIFKAFIRKHSDRVLFGTDMVITGNKEKTEDWIAAINTVCREVLEKDAYCFPLAAKGAKYATKDPDNERGVFRGLGLDDETLRKIYETNIQGVFAH